MFLRKTQFQSVSPNLKKFDAVIPDRAAQSEATTQRLISFLRVLCAMLSLNADALPAGELHILLTRFLADEGVAELTDYMPIGTDGEQPNEIIVMRTPKGWTGPKFVEGKPVEGTW